MHWIFEKANLKGTMLQNLISFYFIFIFDQDLNLGTKHHFVEIFPWTPLQTPSTSGKCNSLTTNLMMLKFGKILLHLLNKNCFKFDLNPTMDLEGTTIWNKTLETSSWKSFHELHYKQPLLSASVAPSQQMQWC